MALCRVLQIAEDDRVVAGRGTGIGTGGGIRPVVAAADAQVAALHTTLAARDPGQLVVHHLMDEAARLVGAGHHAVAAADAGMPVHHHDAVGALERGPGRADVHTGRVLAVLAHQRQVGHPPGQVVLQLDLADPDRLLVVPVGLGLARLACVWRSSPFSWSQASTQARQPSAHWWYRSADPSGRASVTGSARGLPTACACRMTPEQRPPRSHPRQSQEGAA